MTDDLVGRLRSVLEGQVTTQRLIEISHVVSEAAARIEALEAALKQAHALVECIEQTSNNVWWVNATDPETAVCDTFSAIEDALRVAQHLKQENSNG